MHKHKIALITLLAPFVFGASSVSAEVTCPTQTSEPPAITATGPYQIVDFGTTNATVTGLPDCASAQDYAVKMIDAAGKEASAVITLADDSAYSVTLVQD